MRLTRSYFAALVCTIMLIAFTTGCGSSPTTPSGSSNNPTAATNLKGNWLIVGPLPTSTTTVLSLVMNFEATSSGQILSGLSIHLPCGNGETVYGGTDSFGNVASDGTFTWKESTPFGLTLTVTGTVPTTVGGSWNGTYTIVPPSTCSATTLTGSFSATPLGQLTGRYSGTITTNNGVNLQTVPATITFTQGGTVTSQSATAEVQTLLNASMTSSDSCLTSGKSDGTANPGTGAYLAGGIATGYMTLNDGTQASFRGYISANDASTLTLSITAPQSGTCGKSLIGLGYPVFTRQ